MRPCVRPCVRAYDVTNLYKAKFENRDRYRLTFFLMGWYKQGVVQWQTKLGLRMEKALGNIDFPRFFNKKINNFLTMIDMDLIFFT